MTHAEARKAIRWFQKRVGITDWKIELEFQDKAPHWVLQEGEDVTISGGWLRPTYKQATIWISATRSQEDGDSLLVNLFHECLHVAAIDADLPHPPVDATEYLWTQLAKICEAAYLAEMKGKRKRIL